MPGMNPGRTARMSFSAAFKTPALFIDECLYGRKAVPFSCEARAFQIVKML
jgi:hypothetical protein